MCIKQDVRPKEEVVSPNFISHIDSMSRNDRGCSGTSSKNCLTQNGPDKMDAGRSDTDRWMGRGTGSVGPTIQNYIPQKYLLYTQQLDCQAGDKDKMPELMTIDAIFSFIISSLV